MTKAEQDLLDLRAGKSIMPLEAAPAPISDGYGSKAERDLAALRAGKPIAPQAPAPRAPAASPYEQHIQGAAKQYGVDPNFVRAVIHTESDGNPKARSPVGAMGLMQLMPGTARNLGVQNPYDPRENVYAGTKYIRRLSDMFGGDMAMVAAAFNAGEGNVKKYGGVPPFKETQGYVPKVLGQLPETDASRAVAALRAGKKITPAAQTTINLSPDAAALKAVMGNEAALQKQIIAMGPQRAQAALDQVQRTKPAPKSIAPQLGPPDPSLVQGTPQYAARLFGPQAFNPVTLDMVKPHGLPKKIGDQALAWMYGAAHEAGNIEAQYRKGVDEKRYPPPPQLTPGSEAQQLAEIRQLQPLVKKFTDNIDQIMSVSNLTAQPYPIETPGRTQRREAKLKQEMRGLTGAGLASYIEQQGMKLTPLQKEALGSIAAAERLKLFASYRVPTAIQKDAANQYLAAGLTGPIVGMFAPALDAGAAAGETALQNTVGKAATKIAEKVIPHDALTLARAAAYSKPARAVAGAVGKAVTPNVLAHGAVGFGAYQGISDLENPDLKLSERAGRIGNAALTGAAIGPPAVLGGEALGVAGNALKNAHEAQGLNRALAKADVGTHFPAPEPIYPPGQKTPNRFRAAEPPAMAPRAAADPARYEPVGAKPGAKPTSTPAPLAPGDRIQVAGQPGLGELVVVSEANGNVRAVHPETGQKFTLQRGKVHSALPANAFQDVPHGITPEIKPNAATAEPAAEPDAAGPGGPDGRGMAEAPAEVAGASNAGAKGPVRPAPTAVAVSQRGGLKLQGRKPLDPQLTADIMRLHAVAADDAGLSRAIQEIGPERAMAAMDHLQNLHDWGLVDQAAQAHGEWKTTQEAKYQAREVQAGASELKANRQDGRSLVQDAFGGAKDRHGNILIPDHYGPGELDAIYKELNQGARASRTYQTNVGKMSLRDLIYDARTVPADVQAPSARITPKAVGAKAREADYLAQQQAAGTPPVDAPGTKGIASHAHELTPLEAVASELGSTKTQTQHLNRAAEILTGRVGGAAGNAFAHIRGLIGDLTGKTLPRITDSSRAAGEAGARYLSSRIAAPELARSMGKTVVGDADPNLLGAVLTEDNLRGVRAQKLDEAVTAHAKAAAARLEMLGGKTAVRRAAQSAGAEAAQLAQDAAVAAAKAQRDRAALRTAKKNLPNPTEELRATEAAKLLAEERKGTLKTARQTTSTQAQAAAKAAAVEATNLAKSARTRAAAGAKAAADAAREATDAAAQVVKARQRAQRAARSKNGAEAYYEAHIEQALEAARRKDAIAQARAATRDNLLQVAKDAQASAVRLRAAAKAGVREAATDAATAAQRAERLKQQARGERKNAAVARGTTDTAQVDAHAAAAASADAARRAAAKAARAQTKASVLATAATATEHVNDRGIYQALRRQANTAQKAADAVTTLVGPDRHFPTERHFLDALADPKIQGALQRWQEHFGPVMQDLYERAQGLDPTGSSTTPRGAHTGVRINLKGMKEGESAIGPAVPHTTTPAGGNLTNARLKRNPFARRASGASAAYDINAHNIIANTYSKTLENANHRTFLKEMVKAGDAVIGEPGQTMEMRIKGEETVPFEIKVSSHSTPAKFTKDAAGNRVQLTQGGSHGNSQVIYVRKSLADEFRVALNVDKPLPRAAEWIGGKVNAASMAGLAEPTVHAWNLVRVLLNQPGMGGSKGGEFVASLGGAPNLILMTSKVMKKAAEVASEENLTHAGHLAEIGALRAPHEGQGLSGLTGAALNRIDRAARLVASDAYLDMANRGLVQYSETDHREFVNQLGQYNRRAQPVLMKALRDTGVSPFLTAGRSGFTNAVRTMTATPALKGANPAAAASMRARMLSRALGTATTIGAISWLRTKDKGGGVFGRPGTPMGHVDTGLDDNEGRHITVNVGALFGYENAARATGVRGAATALQNGQTPAAAGDAAVKDILNTGIGTLAGPFPRALITAASGYGPFIGGQRVAPVAAPGRSQFEENFKAAAGEVNGGIRGLRELREPLPPQRPGSIPPWLERAINAAHEVMPRGTPQVGTTTEKALSLPGRIHGSQLKAYEDDLMRRARQVRDSDRWDFVLKEVKERVAPEDQGRVLRKLHTRALMR